MEQKQHFTIAHTTKQKPTEQVLRDVEWVRQMPYGAVRGEFFNKILVLRDSKTKTILFEHDYTWMMPLRIVAFAQDTVYVVRVNGDYGPCRADGTYPPEEHPIWMQILESGTFAEEKGEVRHFYVDVDTDKIKYLLCT